MNSASGSCHVRSWAMPVLGIGDAGIPVVAIQICSWNQTFQKGITICAGPILADAD
jgi:hypothetical protein